MSNGKTTPSPFSPLNTFLADGYVALGGRMGRATVRSLIGEENAEIVSTSFGEMEAEIRFVYQFELEESKKAVEDARTRAKAQVATLRASGPVNPAVSAAIYGEANHLLGLQKEIEERLTSFEERLVSLKEGEAAFLARKAKRQAAA